MVRREAGLDLEQTNEAGREETGHDEQRHRERDLHPEQRRAKAQAAAVRRAVPTAAQRALRVASAHAPRRQERDREPRHDRHGGCEQQHARVDRHGVDARKVDGRRPDEQREAFARHEETERAADEREHELFEDDAGDEPSAARAERAADRRVAQAADRTGQRQVRQVRARDQHDAADRAEQK